MSQQQALAIQQQSAQVQELLEFNKKSEEIHNRWQILKEDMDLRRPSWQASRPDVVQFFKRYEMNLDVRADKILEKVLLEIGIVVTNEKRADLIDKIKQEL